MGSSCPLCEQGKLYAYDDKVIIRLTGATANGNKITLERCRCNLCQEIFSVDYSGYGNSKYDSAFKTQLVMNKYWNGLPFKRMESCYEMNGCPVPDATQWQLVQSVAKVVEPVYQEHSHSKTKNKIGRVRLRVVLFAPISENRLRSPCISMVSNMLARILLI